MANSLTTAMVTTKRSMGYLNESVISNGALEFWNTKQSVREGILLSEDFLSSG